MNVTFFPINIPERRQIKTARKSRGFFSHFKACWVKLKQLKITTETFVILGTIDAVAISERGEPEDQYRCQMCSQTFPNIDSLYCHQNELGQLELKQTPRGPGYLCWKKGCNQYFKTASALQVKSGIIVKI